MLTDQSLQILALEIVFTFYMIKVRYDQNKIKHGSKCKANASLLIQNNVKFLIVKDNVTFDDVIYINYFQLLAFQIISDDKNTPRNCNFKTLNDIKSNQTVFNYKERNFIY